MKYLHINILQLFEETINVLFVNLQGGFCLWYAAFAVCLLLSSSMSSGPSSLETFSGPHTLTSPELWSSCASVFTHSVVTQIGQFSLYQTAKIILVADSLCLIVYVWWRLHCKWVQLLLCSFRVLGRLQVPRVTALNLLGVNDQSVLDTNWFGQSPSPLNKDKQICPRLFKDT